MSDTTDAEMGGYLEQLTIEIENFKKENIVLIPPIHDFEKNPVEVNQVSFNIPPFENKSGNKFVAVRPADDTETYLGIFLGNAPAIFGGYYNIEAKDLVISARPNPMIFIPDLMTVVFGYESWWGPIKDETQPRQITDDDIQNVWYVKALKELSEGQDDGNSKA